MAIIVGLDLSMTSAGIAILRDGRPISLHVEGVKGGIKTWHHRVTRITTQSNAIAHYIHTKIGVPDLTIIEAPLTFGGENSADTYDRYTLFFEMCRQLNAWNTRYEVVHNQTRAAWATGKGDASTKDLTAKQRKQRVLEAVRVTWAPWKAHITNHDIADALVLAEIGARFVGDPLHFEPRRRHIESLARLNWTPLTGATQ